MIFRGCDSSNKKATRGVYQVVGAYLSRFLCFSYFCSKNGDAWLFSFFSFPTRLQFLMRASMAKTRISSFFMIRRQHQTRAHIRYHEYHVPGYLYSSSTAPAAVYSRYPDRARTNENMTPLESSHRHHRPGRAASARAARGRCFDPKRAATAPKFGARSGSREHRVGSLVGQDQTQPYSNGSRGGIHYHHAWP